MRRFRRLLLVALALAVTAGGVWLVWPRDQTPPEYAAVQDGMTREEVEKLLGPAVSQGGSLWNPRLDVHRSPAGDVWVGYDGGRVSWKMIARRRSPLDRPWDWAQAWWGPPPATMPLTMPSAPSAGQQ